MVHFSEILGLYELRVEHRQGVCGEAATVTEKVFLVPARFHKFKPRENFRP